ncbi:MAG TPA: diguanylate cyclase [Spirochaetota bacterium]|nr:diguanylate cyclase [Spirochaetota bacterium]
MKSFELLSKIALATIDSRDFDVQMNSILKIVGHYTQVCRTYIFIDNEDHTTTSNTYEWCNRGIEPQIDTLQEIPYAIIPSCQKMLSEEGRLLSNNIHELPEDLVAMLQPQGIVAILIYPLFINGIMCGFVGFDDCKIHRRWSDSDLNLLATISVIISNIYENHFYHKKVDEEKKNFESLINTIDDFIIIGDSKGDILYTNSSVVSSLGYSAEELGTMNILDLHPAHKRDEASEILGEMFSGKRSTCPLELAGKQGVVVPVETRIWFGKWNDQDCIFGLSKNLSKEQEALQKFTKLFNNNPALMAVSSLPDRTFIDVNTSFIEKLGYSYDEIIGKTSEELDLFIESGKLATLADELRKTGRINDIELKVKCKNNDILEGLFSGEIIESQGKQYFLTVMVDITGQKYLQNRYENERTRLQSIIEGTRLGTWEWNIQTGETVFNERWAGIIGYTLDELQPVSIETWVEFTHPDDLKESNLLLERHFSGEIDYYDIECRMKHKNGQWVWVQDRGKVIKWDEKGAPLKMYGTHSDITEKKVLENKILELSIRDPLTNVYNRRYIFNRLDKDFAKFRRDADVFSISLIDIDHFKAINDTYGHQSGDYILIEFCRILSEHVREYDLLGRYGGEEFIIITYGSDKKQTAEKIHGILEIVRTTVFRFNDKDIQCTFSGGVADVSELQNDNLSIENIISIADYRLYNAKAGGRNRINYNGDMQRQ